MIRAAAVALLVCLAATARADVIELTDGTRLVGEIVRTDSEFVWTRVGERVQRVVRGDVRRIQADEWVDPRDREETAASEQEADPPTTDSPTTDSPTTDTPTTEPAKTTTPEEVAQRAAVRARVVQLMELDSPQSRVRAREELVLGWPSSSEALDAALTHESARIRGDAVRVLTEKRLGDQTERLLEATKDTTATVRVLAVRSIRKVGVYSRHRKHERRADVERRLLELVSKESQWAVVQEALRTLETVGTAGELEPVIQAFRFADSDHRRRRIRRTLAAVLGRDLGDDADADTWAKAMSKLARPDAPR